MKTPRRRLVLVIAVSAWLIAGWFLFTRYNPTPSAQFSDWIGARRSPAKIGFLEKTAQRNGFRFFAEQRAKADQQLTEDLLNSPDFTFIVASSLDTGRQPIVKLVTWPHLEKAFAAHLHNRDPQALREALLLTTKEGFSPWELTLVRSAALNQSEDELTNTLNELRLYEKSEGLDSSLSDSLNRVAELYSLPVHRLARLLLSSPDDPVTHQWVTSILADRRISSSSAFSQLLRDLKSGPLLPSDWEIVGKLTHEPGIGNVRPELLTWLLLSPGCEAYRGEHLPDLEKTIDALAMADQESARTAISEVFHQLTEKSAVLSSDWRIVVEWLANRVGEEVDLSNLITNSAGSEFIWILRKLDKEILLDRAILEWSDSLTDPWIWIGEFIDHQHYSAVCRVIETSVVEIIGIDSRHEPTSYNKPKTLAYYTELIDKIVPHTQDAQVKGFIHLDLSMRAVENLRDKPGHEEAKAEVLKAIQMLNRSTSTSRLLLEQTALRLVKGEKGFFEAGRPSFDAWRNGTTLDMVIAKIYRNEWEPGNRETGIWKEYAKKVAFLDEAPGLKAIIDSISKMPPLDENTKNTASRLKDFLVAPQWESLGKFDHLELAVWPLKKLVDEKRLAESVSWMFTLVRGYSQRHPEADEGRLLKLFYEEITPLIYLLPTLEVVTWLDLVLNAENSGEFDWPESFNSLIFSRTAIDTGEASEIFRSAFVSHPLRPWIVRTLLESASFKGLEARRIGRIQIRETLTEEWQIKVMDAIEDRCINPDDFERDMVTAPAGARRYFLSYLQIRQFKKHSTKRDLNKQESFQLLFWQAEQLLEIVERNRPFNSKQFGNVFEGLLLADEELKIHPRMQNILTRLQSVSVDGPRPGMYPGDVKSLVHWQARTAHLGKGGQSEIDNLLTNEALPVTERAWALVLNNHHAEARQLMEEKASDLNFAYPPNTDPNAFLAEAVVAFPGTFPENSMLRIYGELYLQTRRRVYPYIDRSRDLREPWPNTAKAFETFEEIPGRLARRFEATEFTNKNLKDNIFYILCQVRGIAALMPTKVEEMMGENPDEHFADRLQISQLEAQLSRGNVAQFEEKLARLETQRGYLWGLDEGLNVLRYHLWRKCIRNEAFLPEEKQLLETLSFEEFPAKVLMGANYRPLPNIQSPESLSKIRAMLFALALIESSEVGKAPPSWSDLTGVDFERYQSFWTKETQFFYHAALVIAARTRNEDEAARWNWMTLFQADPPSSPRTKPLRTFTMFAGVAYVSEDEVKRCGRDFALKFPEDGWTFLTLAQLGKHFKDDSLAEFGLTGASPYLEADPQLKRQCDRLTAPPVKRD